MDAATIRLESARAMRSPQARAAATAGCWRGITACARAGEACQITLVPASNVSFPAFTMFDSAVRACHPPFVYVPWCDSNRCQPTFFGTLLYITQTIPTITAYNFLSASAAGIEQWTLRSNGFISSMGGARFRGPVTAPSAQFSGGETISAGGLVLYGGSSIGSGGAGVVDGSIITASSASGLPMASLRAGSLTYTGSVLSLSTAIGGSPAFRCAFIRARSV
jgi:hypothetical protein